MDLMRERVGRQVAWISIWSNVILTLSKIIVGWYASSEAVFADGLHSAADVFASVVVLLVIGLANKPADEDHPYGHGKAEVIISGIVGVILVLVSIYVIYEAVVSLLGPMDESPKVIAIVVALFSYISKVILYRYSLRMAKTHNSKAMEAIAHDHKADIVASLAAAIGVAIAILGENIGIDALLYADAVASIIVAILIFKISKEMLLESFHILMERNVNSHILKEYEEIILSFPQVRRIDRIRAREHGHYIMLDLRISIDHFRTIKEGHDLGRQIKEKIMKKHDNVREVLIHLNPYFDEVGRS